jgi:hypothetical protein
VSAEEHGVQAGEHQALQLLARAGEGPLRLAPGLRLTLSLAFAINPFVTTELLAEKADPAKKAKPRPTEADAKKS